MLIAAAVCPNPPVLIPALSGAPDAELVELRERCAIAVATLAPYDVLYVVGLDTGLRSTTFAPWGGDTGAATAVDVPEPLPLGPLIGGWLTAGTQRSFVAVAPDLDAEEAAQLGAELAASAGDVALLVMADGSARHDVKAPGYLDGRAAAFDAAVAAALAANDWRQLLALDPTLTTELLVAGRVPWQVLAGAALAPPDRGASTRLARTLLAEFSAPYGVGYHVAAWRWM